MRVDNLEQMLSAMGYKIMIVPKDTPVPEDGYKVENEREDLS